MKSKIIASVAGTRWGLVKSRIIPAVEGKAFLIPSALGHL